jgi:hypothetical protein
MIRVVVQIVVDLDADSLDGVDLAREIHDEITEYMEPDELTPRVVRWARINPETGDVVLPWVAGEVPS